MLLQGDLHHFLCSQFPLILIIGYPAISAAVIFSCYIGLQGHGAWRARDTPLIAALVVSDVLKRNQHFSWSQPKDSPLHHHHSLPRGLCDDSPPSHFCMISAPPFIFLYHVLNNLKVLWQFKSPLMSSSVPQRELGIFLPEHHAVHPKIFRCGTEFCFAVSLKIEKIVVSEGWDSQWGMGASCKLLLLRLSPSRLWLSKVFLCRTLSRPQLWRHKLVASCLSCDLLHILQRS